MSDAFEEDLFNVFDQNTETHVTPTDKTSSSRSDEKRLFVNFIYVFWNPFHFVPSNAVMALNYRSSKIYHIKFGYVWCKLMSNGKIAFQWHFPLSGDLPHFPMPTMDII